MLNNLALRIADDIEYCQTVLNKMKQMAGSRITLPNVNRRSNTNVRKCSTFQCYDNRVTGALLIYQLS